MEYIMKIKILDKFVNQFGEYGYLIVGLISMIISGYFALMAILYIIVSFVLYGTVDLVTISFYYLIPGYIFLFIVKYCWNKDDKRIKNEDKKVEEII